MHMYVCISRKYAEPSRVAVQLAKEDQQSEELRHLA